VICQTGQLQILSWIFNKFNLTADDIFEDPIRTVDPLHAFYLAGSAGHLEVMKWLISKFGTDERCCEARILQKVCEKGRLNMVQWLVQHLGVEQVQGELLQGCFEDACKNGRLHVAKWFVETFNMQQTSEFTVRLLIKVCSRKQLLVAEWLDETFAITKTMNRSMYIDEIQSTFVGLCRLNWSEMAVWFADAFKITGDDVRYKDNRALRAACEKGDLNQLKWFVQHFGLNKADVCGKNELLNQALNVACIHNHTLTVQWMFETFSLDIDDLYLSNGETIMNQTLNSDIVDILYRVFAQHEKIPVGQKAQENYYDALTRAQSMQKFIKSARR
jgi:hypothetical protein